MNAEMVVFDADFFTLLKGSADPGGLTMPFTREILLLETYVAGTTYVDDIKGIGRELSVLDLLIMRREPLNPYDERAILILDGRGRKLGYVPRNRNEVLANLMDAGKYIFGAVKEKRWSGSYLHVAITIHMKDI